MLADATLAHRTIHSHIIQQLTANGYTFGRDIGKDALYYENDTDMVIISIRKHVNEDYIVAYMYGDVPIAPFHVQRGVFLTTPDLHFSIRSQTDQTIKCGSCGEQLNRACGCDVCDFIRNELHFRIMRCVVLWSSVDLLPHNIRRRVLDTLCFIVVHHQYQGVEFDHRISPRHRSFHNNLIRWFAKNQYDMIERSSKDDPSDHVCVYANEAEYIHINASWDCETYNILSIHDSVSQEPFQIDRGIFLLLKGLEHTMSNELTTAERCCSCDELILMGYPCLHCSTIQGDLHVRIIPTTITWMLSVSGTLLPELKNIILSTLCKAVVRIPIVSEIDPSFHRVHKLMMKWLKAHNYYRDKTDGFGAGGEYVAVYVNSVQSVYIYATKNGPSYQISFSDKKEFLHIPRGLFLLTQGLRIRLIADPDCCGQCYRDTCISKVYNQSSCYSARDELHKRTIPNAITWMLARILPPAVQKFILDLLCAAVVRPP